MSIVECYEILLIYLTGALSFPQGLSNIFKWANSRKVKVSLYSTAVTDKFESPASRPNLDVICREFVPTADLPLSKKWNGGTREIKLPAFAISPHKRNDISRQMDRLLECYRDKLTDELRYGQDELVFQTLIEASRNAGPNLQKVGKRMSM